MKRIYFDNACTSFPKPQAVADSVFEYMTGIGANINRGSYSSAYETENTVYETRVNLAALFNAPEPKNVVFTRSITESLNTVIKGYLNPGDHVIVSSMEHNAIMRPLNELADKDISFDRIQATPLGELKEQTLEDEIKALIKPNTKAIIMTHVSNVCGTIMPIRRIGEIAHAHNIKFILDTAGSAGILPIDMVEDNIDALCFTGHKGLLGPQGIGGFILNKSMIDMTRPLITGGTGSISHTEDIPTFMPDKFEAGTMNIPGIIGLNSALDFINETKTDNIRQKELKLTEAFLNGLMEFEDSNLIRIIGHKDIINRTGIVSIQCKTKDNATVAHLLDSEYGIMTRVGIHCAPAAHKTLGTYPTGTIRFSFGYFNTIKEVNYALTSLKSIL